MKKLFCLLLIVMLLVPHFSPAHAASNYETAPILSQMTDEECVAFVKEYDIPIPSDYSELEWAEFIKKTIASVEDNPGIHFAYNSKRTLNFANAIKSAVISYYSVNQIATSSISTMSSTASLQYSTVYASWSSTFLTYNCYSYAINRPDGWYEPGNFSGISNLTYETPVSTWADAVYADLNSLGYNCVHKTTICPTYSSLNSGQYAIAIRIGKEDYHFMRLNSDGWVHKPGDTTPLKYNYTANARSFWDNEAYVDGLVIPADIEYDSDVYFLVYASSHNIVNTTTGNHYHSGAKHFYEYADVCAECNTIIGNRTWQVVVCSGPPCVLQLSEPPLFSTY